MSAAKPAILAAFRERCQHPQSPFVGTKLRPNLPSVVATGSAPRNARGGPRAQGRRGRSRRGATVSVWHPVPSWQAGFPTNGMQARCRRAGVRVRQLGVKAAGEHVCLRPRLSVVSRWTPRDTATSATARGAAEAPRRHGASALQRPRRCVNIALLVRWRRPRVRTSSVTSAGRAGVPALYRCCHTVD